MEQLYFDDDRKSLLDDIYSAVSASQVVKALTTGALFGLTRFKLGSVSLCLTRRLL